MRRTLGILSYFRILNGASIHFDPFLQKNSETDISNQDSSVKSFERQTGGLWTFHPFPKPDLQLPVGQPKHRKVPCVSNVVVFEQRVAEIFQHICFAIPPVVILDHRPNPGDRVSSALFSRKWGVKGAAQNIHLSLGSDHPSYRLAPTYASIIVPNTDNAKALGQMSIPRFRIQRCQRAVLLLSKPISLSVPK